MRWRPLIVAVCLCPLQLAGLRAAETTPEQMVSMLASLHPDYGAYISSVRYGPTRLHPATLYAGLVRSGGLDPRDPDHAPATGRGATNVLIIYADMFEPWRSQGWRLLIADHEYFHARHLARGFDIPLAGFGVRRADTAYREALAWAWVLSRSLQGIYGPLSDRERSEVSSRYTEHYEAFFEFVSERQASAWAHYGRFLPGPESLIRQASSAPTAATPPPAGPATR